MRRQDIQAGKTYKGRSGPPRTVTARQRDKHHTEDVFNVLYTSSREREPRRCWCETFASWALAEVGAPPTYKNLVDMLDDASRAIDPSNHSRLHGEILAMIEQARTAGL